MEAMMALVGKSVSGPRWYFLVGLINTCKLWAGLVAVLIVSLNPFANAAQEFCINNQQLVVTVNKQDGAYDIRANKMEQAAVRSGVAAHINHHWISSKEYPTRRITTSDFEDVLGQGKQLTVTFTGLVNRANLVYIVRAYDERPFGSIEVQVQNRTSKVVTVEAIRSLNAVGKPLVNLGGRERSERVLSDAFSESNVHIYDLAQPAQGMHFGINSQLIYDRDSRQSLFFGALSEERFVTILRLQVDNSQSGPTTKSYTIDSTGTTEQRLKAKWFRELPPEDHVELSLPVAPGASLSSERLMFAVGNDYHEQLENYGAAIRKLHHARVDGPSLMGWWTSPMEYNMTVNQGQAYTNAQWLAQHLKPLGYDFFQIDSPYAYTLGEATAVNAAMYPHGMWTLARDISSLGLKLGLWVAPFEVGERSWVAHHHRDWLVRNASGQPIEFPVIQEVQERFFVLDVTHPGAQRYLRQMYRTLVREWGARYIKLDYMDITAVEGYYHRPHTTALEALKAGLQVIRDAVGDDVFLDKDGSPMLTPVGIVDQGRVDGDAGHSFAVWKDRSIGILARYYMHRNFFVNDPDAFTLLREIPGAIHDEYLPLGPLTLDEAQISIVLAAITGGMFSIGDDLPSLSTDPARAALLTNKDVLQMVKLGRASRPLDLLKYSPDDLQPSVTFLREDDRQAILTVFNWTEQPRSHTFDLADLGLLDGHDYKLYDVLNRDEPLPFDGKKVALTDQQPHSVRLIKIIDQSQPPKPPKVVIDAPESGKVDEALSFAVKSAENGVLPLDCHWDFGDGVTAEGAKPTHTYTLAGTYAANVTVDGVDGVPAQKTFPIKVDGRLIVGPPVRFVDRNDPEPRDSNRQP
jgi:hypothetical protein